MSSVGIITIQKCGNLGADLQAYALGKMLRSLGYEAENIDYLFYKNPRHVRAEGESPIFKLSLVNKVKEILFPVIMAFRDFRKHKLVAARRARFDDWCKRFLKCGKEYTSVHSLYASPPLYDVYMVGSDQVWNPRMGSNILPYFLDFIPFGARCVSYASSFGVSELPAQVFIKYRKLLRKFTHIGLREASGLEIVKRMRLDADVKQVLDPTLLLSASDWDSVTSEPNGDGVQSLGTEPYLLLYDLISSPETVKLAHSLADQRGIKVVRVGDGAYGPGEFVWLFSHATCVVTNSFHGTAFSLIHGKDFVSVIPRGMTNSSRIESLLAIAGLEDQLVHAESWDTIESFPAIDWTIVRERLDNAKRESIEFLRKAVEGKVIEGHRRPKIGNMPRGCYAVWSDDPVTRAQSTSGGIFSWLAEATIRKGGIVFGAAFDNDFKHVHHVAAETLEDLAPIRKSKYVASDARLAIKGAVEQLRQGREVLFSGCPCQCWAVKAAAKGFETNLITVDFVCHGTPRPEVFAAYVDYLEKNAGSKLTRYDFRNKDKGWNCQNIYYEFDNGKKCRVIPWLDPFFHGFFVNAFLSPGCYHCPFATLERVSDITIADCWRVAASHPHYDDNLGTSLVLGNGEKGMERLRGLGINTLPGGVYPLDLAEKRNAALLQPASRSRYAPLFDRVFRETGSFGQASLVYLTPFRRIKYRLFYWVKRVGWFYFKHHQ